MKGVWYCLNKLNASKFHEILYFFRTTFGRYDEEEDDSSRIAGGRFRSRFLRGDDDDESGGNRSSMYDESGDKNKNKVERVKVVDTEDCSRGPLSGCIRLADSSRVIQRLKVSIVLDQFACHAFVWWTTFRVWQTNYWG